MAISIFFNPIAQNEKEKDITPETKLDILHQAKNVEGSLTIELTFILGEYT